MKTFIGTKIINAAPMSRADYNTFRGWTLPADEDGADEGYLVEYTDGGKPNVPGYAGYVSWSPKAQFDGAYRETAGLTFGVAVEALKLDKKVARAGWNGKGMWLCFVAHSCNSEKESHAYHHGIADVKGLPWIGMKTADNCFVPWLASQTDMLAEDWVIL